MGVIGHEGAQIARSRGATVTEQEENRGGDEAVRTIFEHAAATEYEALVLLNGDCQHLPKDILKSLDLFLTVRVIFRLGVGISARRRPKPRPTDRFIYSHRYIETSGD